MAGFVIQENGFIRVGDLIQAVVAKLEANGFSRKFPVSAIAVPAPDTFEVTLEAGATVDPLAATQPWRIHFKVVDEYQVKMYVASNTQLPDDGTISKMEVGFSTIQDNAGVIGSDTAYEFKLDASTLIIPDPEVNTTVTYTPASVARMKRINNADRQFIDRSIRIPDLATAANYPLSYMLTVTPRGIVLTVWEEGQDSTGNRFSWVCVQRPVDRNNGAVLVDTSTKCPVFCVYGLPDKYIPAAIKAPDSTDQNGRPRVIYPERWESGIKKFVVREIDVLKPTPSVPATYDTEDSAAILNATKQVVMTEDGKYVLVFPNRLNTPRYAYTHDLDLIAITSSDVVSQRTDAPIRCYGEPADRIYKAQLANGVNNTAMRFLQLVVGGGI